MSPAHALAVYQAETERLFRRATAIAGLVLAGVFGLIGPLGVLLVNTFIISPGRDYLVDEMAAQGQATQDIDFEAMGAGFLTWSESVYTTYYGRNLMFLPILIFLLGGLSMASEFTARTTREDVLRPMPRWGILLCKWAALVTWIVAANAITSGLSGLGGLAVAGGFSLDEGALLGVDEMGTWEAVKAYTLYIWNPLSGAVQMVGSTFLTDLGFATLALAIAVATRSVAATVASLVMVFVIQLGVAMGFGVLNAPFAKQALEMQAPWLTEGTREAVFAWVEFLSRWQPPFVIGTCSFSPATWESFLTLGTLTVLALLAGMLRFETMDVP
jgi:ABC-type transport system involved in multi-copper enzyme maturation permease subunit